MSFAEELNLIDFSVELQQHSRFYIQDLALTLILTRYYQSWKMSMK